MCVVVGKVVTGPRHFYVEVGKLVTVSRRMYVGVGKLVTGLYLIFMLELVSW
jgi:hypothetical protein